MEVWTSGDLGVGMCTVGHWGNGSFLQGDGGVWFLICHIRLPLFLNPMLYSFYFQRDGFYYVIVIQFSFKQLIRGL